MPSVVRSLHYVLNPLSEIPWWTVSGRFWITAFMGILIPLCFLRRLDSLRHTSYVALFSVGKCIHLIGSEVCFHSLLLPINSILGYHRGRVPLSPSQGERGAWRMAPGALHSVVHFYIPGASVRVYLRAERRPSISSLSSPILIYRQLFPIYNELVSNTQRRMNLVIGTSLGGTTVVYEIISIFGYLTFGTNVSRCAHSFLWPVWLIRLVI
jgi:hypothetical protein